MAQRRAGSDCALRGLLSPVGIAAVLWISAPPVVHPEESREYAGERVPASERVEGPRERAGTRLDPGGRLDPGSRLDPAPRFEAAVSSGFRAVAERSPFSAIADAEAAQRLRSAYPARHPSRYSEERHSEGRHPEETYSQETSPEETYREEEGAGDVVEFVAIAGDDRVVGGFRPSGSQGDRTLERDPGGEARSDPTPSRAAAVRRPPDAMLEQAEYLSPSEDRSRLLEQLGLVRESLLNPYEQSTIKGDRPIFRDDWYLSVGAELSTVYEFGRVLGEQGNSRVDASSQSLFPSLSLTRGTTTFRPPDWRFQLRAGASVRTAESLAGRAQSGSLERRDRADLSVEEFFIERHLRNLSDRYDFQSLRIGSQPLIADFRGFLIQDHQPAVRFFGNARNNQLQYNAMWIRRLAKDPVSGLNSDELRDEDLWLANLYLQDVPVLGFQLQGVVLYHRDRERSARTELSLERSAKVLGASMRPVGDRVGERIRGHDVVYLGANGDGHLGRLNLTFSSYAAMGRDEGGPVGSGSRSVSAYFGAAEASVDFDWYRIKAYAMLASGDSDPLDDRSEGFDFVRDRPTFGGLEDGFWQRESMSLSFAAAGGSGVQLVARDGVLPSLRSRADKDAANFVNPGLRLFGLGADFDVLPELRLRLNATYMEFDDTASLRFLSGERSIRRHLGEDYSLALIYRPWFINNVSVRVSAAAFMPGGGLIDLGLGGPDAGDRLYSARVGLTLQY